MFNKIKKIFLPSAGNLIGAVESFISLLVISQLLKEDETPVGEPQIISCASTATGLFVLRSVVSYFLLKTEGLEPNDQNQPLLDHPSCEKKLVAYTVMSMSGVSKFLLDFAALSSALITRWPNPQGGSRNLGYGSFIALFVLISSTHGVVVGLGMSAQSMRKGGFIPRAMRRSNEGITHSCVKALTQIVLGFMTFAYAGGTFNSSLNLLIFYGGNNLSHSSRYGISGLMTLLSVPMLYMDYLIVKSKVIYTYWTFGFSKQLDIHGCQTPLGSALRLLHDKTYFQLFDRYSSDPTEIKYDRSLYWSKMVTRIGMLSGFFYNLMKVFLATDKEIYVQDYPSIAVLPAIISFLGAFSAHLEWQSLSYAPILAIEAHIGGDFEYRSEEKRAELAQAPQGDLGIGARSNGFTFLPSKDSEEKGALELHELLPTELKVSVRAGNETVIKM